VAAEASTSFFVQRHPACEQEGSFTCLKRLLWLLDCMAQLRMEVLDLRGERLQELCSTFDDPQLPVDHAALAKFHLSIIRDCGRLSAHSVRFFRESEEIGSWSLDREYAEAMLAQA
jgi:hypothetical protein